MSEHWHEAANLFPLMDEQELAALAADIAANGLLNPIVMLDGKVLDGRNRLLACKLAGVEPSFRQWDQQGSPVVWAISQNVQRRNLTASQKALIAVEAEDLMRTLAEEAKQRQRMGSEKIPYPEQKGKTTEKAAQIFGVNEKYVRDMKRIKAEAPALVPQIKSGTLSVPCALRQMEWSQGAESNVRLTTICEMFFRVLPRDVAEEAYRNGVQRLGADSDLSKSLEYCWFRIQELY